MIYRFINTEQPCKGRQPFILLFKPLNQYGMYYEDNNRLAGKLHASLLRRWLSISYIHFSIVVQTVYY